MPGCLNVTGTVVYVPAPPATNEPFATGVVSQRIAPGLADGPYTRHDTLSRSGPVTVIRSRLVAPARIVAGEVLLDRPILAFCAAAPSRPTTTWESGAASRWPLRAAAATVGV